MSMASARACAVTQCAPAATPATPTQLSPAAAAPPSFLSYTYAMARWISADAVIEYFARDDPVSSDDESDDEVGTGDLESDISDIELPSEGNVYHGK